MTTSAPISSVVFSRYAGALIDLAEEAKAVSKVDKDFDSLRKMMADSDDLQSLIDSPLVSQSQQIAAISDIAKKAKLHKLTQNFLGVLVENGRLNALPGVITAYKKIISARSGEIDARVETAVALTATQKKNLQDKISKSLGCKVAVESVVTPDIIGGMVVTIGSYMVDDSVRRKLERLNAEMKNNANQNVIHNVKEVV